MLTPEQVEEVKATVREADRAFDRRDYEGFSRKIWDATAQAIGFIAKQRGWPHATFDEVYECGKRIAHEYDDGVSALQELRSAEFCKVNGDGLVLQRYEIEEDRDLTYTFVERLAGTSLRSDSVPRRRAIALFGEEAKLVKAMIKDADAAFARKDYQEFYAGMWDATAQAIRFVAMERGWPHETDANIEAAGLRLARDYEDDLDAMAELGFALFARANGRHLELKDYEISEDWEVSVRFVDRLLGTSSRYKP